MTISENKTGQDVFHLLWNKAQILTDYPAISKKNYYTFCPEGFITPHTMVHLYFADIDVSGMVFRLIRDYIFIKNTQI
jgi:hypothetical protein